MKTPVQLLAAVISVLVATSTFSQAAGWTEDYAKAVAQAIAENKAVLLDFTGSDWCGWCMKMKSETLDAPQFTAYAQKNLVLVMVDFPHQRVLAPAVKKQNEMLNGKFHADGFPTYVLIDKTGRELWRQTGYLAGCPTAFTMISPPKATSSIPTLPPKSMTERAYVVSQHFLARKLRDVD